MASQVVRSLWRSRVRPTTVIPLARGFCVTAPDRVLVAKKDMRDFIVRCMVAVGTNKTHATALADNLAEADYRGHHSHGTIRTEMYVHDIRSGVTRTDGNPVVIKEMAGTAYVDGRNMLGPVVGNYSMNLAIQKAKQAGIGWVTAKGSNHYGIAASYALQACELGLIGMSFTNTSPLVFPTRASQFVMGTNPISVCAPGKEGDSFELDMATSTVALGKIELSAVKGETMPHSWGADSKGKETLDPKLCVTEGGLQPLGGTEITGGYKGYGMAIMVDIICGILGGAKYGPNIRRWKTTDTVADLGQCFVAIDPEAFAPGFPDRMQDLMDTLRGLPTIEEEGDPVLIPGDPEKAHMAKCDEQGGIHYHPNVIKKLENLAESVGVLPVKRKDA